MELFSYENLSDFIKRRKHEISEEINELSDSQINNCDFDEWAEYFLNQYFIEPIEIYEQNNKIDLDKKKIRKDNFLYQKVPYEKKYIEVDGYCLMVTVYFTGDVNLFKTQPNIFFKQKFECNFFSEPKGEECGFLRFDFEFASIELEKLEEPKPYIDNIWKKHISIYKEMIVNINNQVGVYNKNLNKYVIELLKIRKNKASKFKSLADKLEISILLNDNVPNISPIKLERINRIPQKKPQYKKQETEYCIKDSDYENINNIINMSGSTMEKTARTYLRNNEEELRDLLLATLNTHYSNATGETFRKIGKTDILIEFENKAAFIGECKIWYGIKEFKEAIQQVINYSTWKDLKVSLIIFNKKNKVFHGILDTVSEWVNDNTKEHQNHNYNTWKCKYFIKDKQLVIDLNIAIFDLYVDESQIKDNRYENKKVTKKSIN